MKKVFLTFFIASCFASYAQEANNSELKKYKEMMYDNSYNFYDVVEAAEAYFNTIDREAKGSGWKPYQRWKIANEYKYYPDGDRSKVDPFFVKNQYQQFVKNNPSNKALYNGMWKDLGPYTLDSITGHYSAGLGRIEDMYVSPVDSMIMYLGSRSGGFWRSIDGGATWEGTTDFLFASGVNTLTVSPTSPDTVLINVRNARNGYSHGIYRSSDGGLTWSQSNFNPTNIGFGGLGDNFQIYEIAYHPRVKDLVFIGTNKGIYKSTDDLATWTIQQTNFDFTEIAFHPSDDSLVYLYNTSGSTTSNRVFRSTDQGLTYGLSSNINGNNGNERVELVTSPQCDDCLWFASNNGVWVSYDKGLNFNFLSNSSETCGGFAVSDVDTSMMIYGYVDLDGSTDGGRSFSDRTRWSLGNTNGAGNGFSVSYKTSTDYIHADLRNAKCVNGVFYVATDGFLSKSNDNGTTWTILSEGVGTRENYNLGLSQSNHYRTISGSQDNGTSINTENGWVEFYGADGMEGIIHPLNDDWMLGSIQFGGRRKTKNGGFSQSGVTPSGSSNAYWVAPLAYDPNNHMRVFDFRDVVYMSDDFAENYTNVGAPSFTGDIQLAAIAENNSDIIIVARGSSIEKSTDGGANFTSIKNNLPGYSIRDISFNPKDDDNIFVVYGRYQVDNRKVFMTTDGGNTWTNITYNLGSMPISSVVIDHSAAANIYVGAEIGVYTKPMSGTTWTLYNNGLPNMDARELEINYGSNTIRTATWGRGLWEYNLVGRADYPAIMHTSISSTPTLISPKEGVDQFVTSKIHYTGSLSSVYVEWSQDSAVFGNQISMTNTIDSTWVSNQAFPQLPVGTKVYFKVVAVGSTNDTTETYKFMYEVHPFAYCNAIGTSNAGNLFLDNVSLGSLSNNSNNGAYTLYQTPVANLFADSTYTLNLSANTGWGSNDYGAWIDYNGNADFELNERILYDLNSGGSSSASFTVPSNINPNDTVRMRVRLSYWGPPETCDSQFGEVEDYLVALKNITTSIADVQQRKGGVSLFPNPSEGSFVLEFDELNTNQLIRIYNSQGSLIKEEFQGSQKRMFFNLNIPAGTYFVSVEKEGERFVLPIMINK